MFDKVLLIDDDDISLMLCEFVIEVNEFAKETIKLNNGCEGIEFYRKYLERKKQGSSEKIPALIFLDLNMPIMSGWDFLEDFYANFSDLLPETKVVILSSSIDPEDYKRAHQYSIVVDFINKPLADEALRKLKENEGLREWGCSK